MVDFTELYEKSKNLRNLCKYDEASQIIQEIENNLELTKLNHFLIKLEQCRILKLQSKFHDAIANSLECYHECQIEGYLLISLDFVIECVESFFRLGNMKKAIEYHTLGQELLKKLPNITQKEFGKREAMLGVYYSATLWQKGDYENSIPLVDELLQKQKNFDNKNEMVELLIIKALFSNAQGQSDVGLNFLFEAMRICKEINAILLLSIIYNNIGWVYDRLGKLHEALNYLKKGSEIINKTEDISLNCSILDNIGCIYRQLGDLDQSEQFLLEAIKLGEKLGNNYFLTQYYFDIIRTLLEQKKMEYVQHFLLRFGNIAGIENSKTIIFRYKLAQAIVLKASQRTRDRYQAQKMLFDLVQEENFEYDDMIQVIVNLCDLLIADLKTTNEQEIIGEINELLMRMEKMAIKSSSHSLLGESYLLRAKLALVTLDLIESRKLLKEAQKIAETNGLTNLAIHVSNEHDNLLNEEAKLVEMKNFEVGLSERIQYSGIYEQISTMTQEKGHTESEVEEEQPILFLIMNETGTSLYKYSFSPEFTIDAQLLSGFLSAMDAFCEEFFAGSFDRAKFGENFLTLARTPPFVICYIFNGNSYLAQQKIKNFVQKFNANHLHSKEILSRSLHNNCIVNKKDGLNINNLLLSSFQLKG
jgi:tetratricopeptide (TPR) repeat protein